MHVIFLNFRRSANKPSEPIAASCPSWHGEVGNSKVLVPVSNMLFTAICLVKCQRSPGYVWFQIMLRRSFAVRVPFFPMEIQSEDVKLYCAKIPEASLNENRCDLLTSKVEHICRGVGDQVSVSVLSLVHKHVSIRYSYSSLVRFDVYYRRSHLGPT